MTKPQPVKINMKMLTHLTKGLPIELRLPPGCNAVSLMFDEHTLTAINAQCGMDMTDLIKMSKG